jgi:tripartite-type tricarboxylate transporter receptor subunit TctC
MKKTTVALRAFKKSIFTCLAALIGTVAHSQTFPSKPIKFIAGFAPGSSSDTLARLLADKMSAGLGQPIVVENRVGALSTLSADAVARSAPDGYTLTLAANSAMSSAPAGLMQVSYDPLRDFTPLGRVATLEYLVVVSNNLPPKTLKELVAYGKQSSNKLSCASGNASALLSCEGFGKRLGIDLLSVPYKSAPQAVTDVIGGQVPMMFLDVPTGVPQVQGGKLRALAVASHTRNALLPDVPTFTEAGVEGLPMIKGWTALYGPANLPADVAKRLSDELAKAVQSPDFLVRLKPTGWVPEYLPPKEMDEYLRRDLEFWKQSVKTYGLKGEK